MAKSDIETVGTEDDAEITLGLLSAVEENSQITQRSLASDLGIALGLTNAYLKRCVRKGWVKINQAPANRYAYYLTPRGFAEKSRLTAQYLTTSFNFFRGARDQCSALLTECAGRRWHRVVLAGVSDLAEIAVLCAADHEAKIIGIVDPDTELSTFAGQPVAARLKDVGAFDAVIVTDFRNPQEAFDRLAEALPAERILTPKLLNISRSKPVLAE